MTWWHRAGQKVVCVDAAPHGLSDFHEVPRIVEDQVYVVDGVAASPVSGLPELRLVGVEPWTWRVSRFRPATDISSLERIAREATERGRVRS